MAAMKHDRRHLPRFAITLFGLILLTVSRTPRVSAAESAELRVMSFNIRYSRGDAHEEKAENNWNDATHPRRERVIRVIREYGPDILGLQEARNLQIVDLKKALPEYEFYGVGRDDGKKGGEHTGQFYRKDRFERRDAGSFWLSDTPEQPGTTFYKAPNAVPRMASWLRLHYTAAEREFFVLNTHWDHVSNPARRKSAKLIRSRLSELSDGLPVILMGDLNVPEDARATKTLLGTAGSTEGALIDSFRKLYPNPSPDEASFNGWQRKTAGSRIDFILHSRHFTPTAAEIVRTDYDGLWPSDHYPVTATLQFSD